MFENVQFLFVNRPFCVRFPIIIAKLILENRSFLKDSLLARIVPTPVSSIDRQVFPRRCEAQYKIKSASNLDYTMIVKRVILTP